LLVIIIIYLSYIKAIQDSAELEYVNCLAHLLNLVVKVLFEDTHTMPVIVKCRKLVGTFKHSTNLSELLTNTIRAQHSNARPLYVDEDNDIDLELGLDELEAIIGSDLGPSARLRTKLVQDLVTRWNSTLAMLTSVCESHAAICSVITSDQERKKKFLHELLTDIEIGIIEDLIELLDPFLEMTTLVSGSKYVTISIVLPAINRLLECLKLFHPSSGNEFLKVVAENMYESLRRRTCLHQRDLAMFRASTYIKSLYGSYSM